MKFLYAVLGPAVLSGALALTVAAPLRADDCQTRIARADHRLHEAIEHHGWRSAEAQERREELQQARASCWERNHRWWDEDNRRWHSDRDWDEHDHDHDYDRH